MPINQSDYLLSAIKEATLGTTPTTGSRIEVPIKTDQAVPVLNTEQIADDTKRPNREGNAAANGHQTVTVTLDLLSRGGALMDMLIESAISGAFTGTSPAKAIGGTTDSSFTLFTNLKTAAAGSALEYEDAGCMATSWSISANAREGVEASFEVMGIKRTEKTTNNALTLTKLPAAATRHTFADVTVTVAGQTLAYSSLEFSTKQTRDALVTLGSVNPTGIYTSGKRDTVLTLKAYRESFAVNALANTTIAVSFSFGTVGNGYKVTLPAAKLMTPTDEMDESGILVNLEFQPSYDNTTGAGIIVEKL